MQDPAHKTAMKVLMPVHTAAYFAGMRDLYGWFLAKMTNLSLRHGLRAGNRRRAMPVSAACCAAISAEFNDGFDFARLAIALADKYPQRPRAAPA